MAELKIPVRIDGYKCVEEIAQAVLDYTYKGKTLKGWADSISEPQTNADRIRAMTDEELAEWIYKVQDEDALRKGNFLPPLSKSWWLDWLRKEVNE